MIMVLLKMISDNIKKQSENAHAPAIMNNDKLYKQKNTLADMPLGRIRKRGLPFRRPFSL